MMKKKKKKSVSSRVMFLSFYAKKQNAIFKLYLSLLPHNPLSIPPPSLFVGKGTDKPVTS